MARRVVRVGRRGDGGAAGEMRPVHGGGPWEQDGVWRSCGVEGHRVKGLWGRTRRRRHHAKQAGAWRSHVEDPRVVGLPHGCAPAIDLWGEGSARAGGDGERRPVGRSGRQRARRRTDDARG